MAHEFMHAEILERIGPWARLRRLPVWFDEGVAMQVDHRPRYEFPNGEDSRFVRGLSTRAAFFTSDDAALTRNYAAAKAEVAKWLGNFGRQRLYPALEQIRGGNDFDSIVE